MSRLNQLAEQITQALNYIQPTDTDVPELEERRKAIRRSLMDTRALLRAASAETVGTEWPTHSDPCLSAYGRNHNAEVGAARLAIAELKAERDDALASLAEKQRVIDEAFATLDAGHGMLACRDASHILRPHATKATEGQIRTAAHYTPAEVEANVDAICDKVTEAKPPRQWTSTPPKDRSGKWWNAYGVSAAHAHYRHIIPDECSWDNATHLVAESDYDLWLPWQEGDTADNLPPLPDRVTNPDTVSRSETATTAESGDIRYRVWECRVIVPADAPLPDGFDAPPRRAVIDAITSRGIDVIRCASGWGHTPTDDELGVLDEEINYPSQPTTPATTPTAAAATPAADACDTRELIARLADIMRCGFLWTERRERDLAAIIAAARRGGGA